MRIITIFLLAFCSYTLSAQTVAWLKKAGDMSSNCQAFGMVIDHAHNCIVSGSYIDTANFSSTVLNGKGSFDGYIAKYDSSGNLLWAKNFGSTLQDFFGDAAVDVSNNIYVAGYFKSSAIYFTATDSLQKVVGAISNSFVAKFAPDGSFVWAKLISSTSQIETYAITMDPQGNPIVGGTYHTDFTIATSSFPSSPNPYYGLYIAKFTAAGAFSWAKVGYSSGLCKINDITTDASGNIYAAGKVSSTMTFSSIATPNLGGDDVFYSKFDSSGNRLFFKVIGGAIFVTTTSGKLDGANTIKADKNGNFYVGGNMLLTYVVPVSTQCGFLAKYNDTGGQIWMNKFGNINETVTGIALDAANNPYATGLVFASDTIGGSIVPYTTGGNTFIGRFDKTTGNAVWLKNSGTVGGSSGADVMGYINTGAIDVDQYTGGVMVAGQFMSSISFDTYNVTSTTASTKSDIYMVRIWNYVAGVGMPDIAENDVVNVYPNPVKNNISIVLDNAVWHKVFLVNSAGQTVNEWETNERSINTDIHSVPSGNYSVIITDNNNNKVVKKITKL